MLSILGAFARPLSCYPVTSMVQHSLTNSFACSRLPRFNRYYATTGDRRKEARVVDTGTPLTSGTSKTKSSAKTGKNEIQKKSSKKKEEDRKLAKVSLEKRLNAAKQSNKKAAKKVGVEPKRKKAAKEEEEEHESEEQELEIKKKKKKTKVEPKREAKKEKIVEVKLGKREKKKEKKKALKEEMILKANIRRPQTVFFRFVEKTKDELTRETPARSQVELKRELGKRWRELPKEKKQKYFDEHAVSLNKYMIDRAAYLAAKPKPPKRAKTSFIFYLEELFRTPQSKVVTNVLSQASIQWKSLSAEDKKQFEVLAEQDKGRYAQERAAYDKRVGDTVD